MLQNFKTDVIYYNTQTDFEMEFNLCGCCRMRLFNDKCDNKKSLLASLSRAASRSRIIIVTAQLFSDSKIMEIVASAIGKKTEIVRNGDYNIASDSKIPIIEGSLPLVTEDGIFGGCIIESGPQSLIVLTDNQAVRKTLMKELIHPYVKDIAYNEETEIDLVTETDQKDEPEEPQEPSEIKADQNDTPLILDQESENDDEDDEDNSEADELITEIAPIEDDDEDYYYNDDYITDESSEEPNSPFNIWMLVISVVLFVSLIILCYCLFYVPTKLGVSPSAYLKDIFDTLFK